MSIATGSARMFKPTRSPLGYLLLILGVGAAGFVLLILGALTALAPELVVRLTPIFLVGVVMLSAGFVRSESVSSRFVRFWLAAIVVTATLWPSYMGVRVGGLPSIDLRKIVFGLSVLMLFYLTAARPIIRNAWRELAPGAKWLVWCVLIYGSLRIVSAFESPAPVASFLAIAWEWVYFYMPFFAVAFVIRDCEARRQLVLLLFWLALLVAVFVVVERISGVNVYTRFGPVSADSADFQMALKLSRLRDGVFRAQGPFEHPLMLAEFGAIVSAFGLSELLTGKRGSIRLLALVALVGSAVSAVLSGSRIALVGLAIVWGTVILATVVRARGERKMATAVATRAFIMLSLAILLLLAMPLLQTLMEGRTASEASSSSARILMLKTGIPAMLSAPLLGNGYGQVVAIAGVQGTGGILTVDNYLLSVGVDSGIPALLLFISIFMIPAWMAFKKVTAEAGPEQTFLIAGMASLMGMLAVRMILSISYNLVFAFVIAAMVAAAASVKHGTHGNVPRG